jgi:murein DD-endopeptidase MepM/ murein hydrolase activator NlpD
MGKRPDMFGDPNNLKDHRGVDIMAPKGTPVRAVLSGYVFAAKHFQDGTGKGIFINTRGKDRRFFTAYAHLDKILVKEGTRVKKGQVIGLVGETGSATGPHLHIEMMLYKPGTWAEKYFDPTPHMCKYRERLASKIHKNGKTYAWNHKH